MGRRVIMPVEISAILYRWVKGVSARKISQQLDVSRNTVNKVLCKAKSLGLKAAEADSEKIEAMAVELYHHVDANKRTRPSEALLMPYLSQIEEWLSQRYMTVKQVWRLLQEQEPAVTIGINSLHRFISRHIEMKKLSVTMVLHTAPGKQAQVDFAYVGKMRAVNGEKPRKTYAFIMTLSYSRYRFVCFVFRQDVATWIDCHERAFRFFGGVTETVLLDNLKSGVLLPDLYDPTVNRNYAALEQHYGFVVDPAIVRTPEHKGKVERSVTIVKQQVIAGREFTDIGEANRYALEWCQHINGSVVTRTTGEAPKVRFERDEKAGLRPLPETPFELAFWSECVVGRDQHITHQSAFYSVPEQYVGCAVSVKRTQRCVKIYYNHQMVKTHVLAARKGQWVTDEHDLCAAAKHYLRNTPERCLHEAGVIGAHTKQLMAQILQKTGNTTLRKADAILRLTKTYGHERLEAACQRALHFNTTEYKTLKTILEKELDKQPLTQEAQKPYAELAEGAYLRNPEEFIH